MKRRITGWIVIGLVLLSACGCTPAGSVSTAENATETTTPEDLEEASMEAEQVSLYRQQAAGSPFDAETVQVVEGVQVVSGKVMRVGGGMEYTPAAASGCFVINGKLSENSEIAFCINPVSVLRYTLSLQADTGKTVKAEIRAYKQGELLVSYEQETLHLTAGENTVDACIDTGETSPCQGSYDLRFYLDGCLVSETTYTV